jgi:hypothetical protein
MLVSVGFQQMGVTMSEVHTGRNWLDLDPIDRWKANAAEVLRLFRSNQDVFQIDLTVEEYLRSLMETLPHYDASAYDEGIIMMMGFYTPNFVLEPLFSNLTGDSAWEISRMNLISDLRTQVDLSLMLDSVMEFVARFTPRNVPKPRDDEVWLLQDGLEKLTKDFWFRFLALLATHARLKHELKSLNRANPHARISSNGSPHLDAPELQATDAQSEEQLSAVIRYITAKKEMSKRKEEAEQAYIHLSYRDVVKVRGKNDFIRGLYAAIALLYCITATLAGGWTNVISRARAEAISSDVEHHFSPPLGIPLTTWTGMVIVFYLYILVVISVFLWKGYVAKEKSETAAEMVKNIASLAIGVFFGKVSGSLG